MPESELRFLADNDRLREIPGVGEKTAVVIKEALDGKTPAYLQDLLQHVPEPGTDAGEALRATLKGDLHSHSDWSDGGHTIRDMAEKARDLGHEYLALTDHSPRLKIANGLSVERLREQLDDRGRAERGARAVPHPDRRRGRHPRRRRARPIRGDARAGRRRGRQRALEAAHGGGADDAAHGRRDREPARRRARSLHRPDAHRPRPARIGVRRRRRDRGVPHVRHRARDQLPARATRPAARDAEARPSRRA